MSRREHRQQRQQRQPQQQQQPMSESPISTPQLHAITAAVAGAVTEALQRSSGPSVQGTSAAASPNEGAQTPLSSIATRSTRSTR